jgi:hypothetical protein
MTNETCKPQTIAVNVNVQGSFLAVGTAEKDGRGNERMTLNRLDDAPHLSVGNAIKVALSKSNRSEEHYEHSSNIATCADSESPRG